jgi:integral membrane sensor domain MASE1
MAGVSRTLRIRRLGIATVVVAGFMASMLFSLLTARAGGQIASIWTANGFLAGGFILLPRIWSAPAAAICFIAQLIVGVLIGDGWLRALANPVVNTAEAAMAAWLAVRFCGARARRLSMRELLMLPVGAIVPAAIFAGVIGAGLNLVLIGQNPISGWASWAVSGAFGMVIVLPAMLLMTRITQYREFHRPLWEVVAIALGLAALVAPVYFDRDLPLEFLLYPALTFVAFRLGPPGVAIAGGLIGLVTTSMVVIGHGQGAFPATLGAAARVRLVELSTAALLFTSLATAGALADQLRLRRMMLWRDQAARAARLRARLAELLAAKALAEAPLVPRRASVPAK